MPTFDEDEGTLDFVIAVVGAGSLGIEFLVHVGARFQLPAAYLQRDPSVPLVLGGEIAGKKVYFHLSAYDSERPAADGAIAIVGDDTSADDEIEALGLDTAYFYVSHRRLASALARPSSEGNLSDGSGVFDIIKVATKSALTRMKASPNGSALPMPHCVREGFHRGDRAAEPPLEAVGPPKPHRHVKVQVNLREPMESKNHPGQEIGFLALTGQVTEVLGEDAVVAELVATTDMAPATFDGTWRARLERVSGMEFPWILRSLARISKTAD